MHLPILGHRGAPFRTGYNETPKRKRKKIAGDL